MSANPGTHSYVDWQISTLMLAYDAVEPLHRDDTDGLSKREQDVALELQQLARAVIPVEYLLNPQTEYPPEVVMLLTRVTVARAAQILGMVEVKGPAVRKDNEVK
ncbi:MAG: hypothetical protein QM770_24165 [Tepidisphaeraceae bacterium]